LVGVVASLSDAEHAELWWSRDAWQGAGARPPIAEQNIGPEPPVALNKLTAELWRAMLGEAYNCLNPARGHRGRALQWVTLPGAGRKQKEVSPHLQVKRIMWRAAPRSVDEAVAAMNSARQRLDAIYKFVAKTSCQRSARGRSGGEPDILRRSAWILVYPSSRLPVRPRSKVRN
jgi:hypothetical protein